MARHVIGAFHAPWTKTLLPGLVAALLGAAAACSADTGQPGSSTVATIHDLPVEAPAEGHEIGQLSPEFTLRLAGGETLTLTEIIESDRPTFLFFWATT